MLEMKKDMLALLKSKCKLRYLRRGRLCLEEALGYWAGSPLCEYC